MKKPTPTAMALWGLGAIHTLKIHPAMGENEEVQVTLVGTARSLKGNWRTYKDYLDVRVGHNSVATLNTIYYLQIHDYNKFEEENAKELAEYMRLKEKFDA